MKHFLFGLLFGPALVPFLLIGLLTRMMCEFIVIGWEVGELVIEYLIERRS